MLDNYMKASVYCSAGILKFTNGPLILHREVKVLTVMNQNLTLDKGEIWSGFQKVFL